MKLGPLETLYETKVGFQLAKPGALPFSVHPEWGDSMPAVHRLHYELVLVTGGVATSGNYLREYQLTSGNVFLMPPDSVHYYTDTHDFRYINFCYLEPALRVGRCDLADMPEYRALADFADDGPNRVSPIMSVDSEMLGKLVEKSRRLIAELTNFAPGWREAASVGFAEVLVMLLRSCRRGNAGIDPVTRTVRAAATRIEQNCALGYSIGELARNARMSESSFSHHFTRVLGVAPIEYLIRVRLKRAIYLLAFTDSINLVALECGFNDLNYFSRLFRRRFGLSPRAFRRETRRRDFDPAVYIARLNGTSA